MLRLNAAGRAVPGTSSALCLLAFLSAGFIGVGFSEPALARGHCLTQGSLVTGQLQEVRGRYHAGEGAASLHVVLPRPVCVVATLVDGSLGEISDVRAVQFVPAGSGLNLDQLVGSDISIVGSFGEPQSAYHTGDVVLFDARMVAVDDRADRRRGAGRNARAFGDDWRSRMGDGGSYKDAADSRRYGIRNSTEFGSEYRGEYRIAERINDRPDDMADRIARFIGEHYLGSEALSPEQIRGIYADRVHYFGERKRREQIVADKAAYYRRWPQRDYRLLPETLDIREARPGVYDVAFEFYFQVAGKGRLSRGRGVAELTLDLGRGEGRITREGGQVLER